MEVVFLARHGRHHSYLPTEVPYRANIWAMRSLGVRWILSPSAVGSLQQQVKPLDMVVPDQFIDRTHQRPISFFGEGAVAHVALADPFCAGLSRLLADVADSLMPTGRSLHRGGTYLCMEGPAFSTRAESNLYRSWGCTVIGMTNHTEARLAREAEIAYATLAMATDYDCWYADHDSVTVEMVIANLRANAELATQITGKLTIPTVGIGAGPNCDAQVLVWQDMAGMTNGRTAKFVKRFGDVGGELRRAAMDYAAEVATGAFPPAFSSPYELW